MSENCEHVWENTRLVFCTIPGTRIQTCTKCGKQRVHQDEIKGQKQSTDLECDICGHPMTMQKDEDGIVCGHLPPTVVFSCGSHTCKQNWLFSKDHSSCTVLRHLWPSRMEEGSKMYREEFLPDWIKGKEFWANAMFTAGFWDSVKRDEFIQGCRNSLDKWHKDHPLKKRPWWQFWKDE